MRVTKLGTAAKLVAIAGVLPGFVAATVHAADESNAAQRDITRLWNVDQIMRQAAENIARRYNLNQVQREETEALLVDEVTRFLQAHEDIWPLVRDLTRYQIEGKAPSGEVAKKIGAKALPLLQEIEDAIFSANERWREILSPEQRKMHDYDLQDMAKTFGKMKDNFEAMARGEAREARVFPEPNPNANQPARPPRPPRDFVPVPQQPILREAGTESGWDEWVANFIQKYNLDESQADAARSILRECKQRARDHRNANRDKYAEVQRRLDDASLGSQAADVRVAKLRVWKQIERSLNKPIMDLYQELQARVNRIPTDAQRLRVDGKEALAAYKAQQRAGAEIAVAADNADETPAAAGDDAAAKPAPTPEQPAADAPSTPVQKSEPKDQPADVAPE